MSNITCKICGQPAFNKEKNGKFCDQCTKAHQIGYHAGYYAGQSERKSK